MYHLISHPLSSPNAFGLVICIKYHLFCVELNVIVDCFLETGLLGVVGDKVEVNVN